MSSTIALWYASLQLIDNMHEDLEKQVHYKMLKNKGGRKGRCKGCYTMTNPTFCADINF